MFSVRRTNLKCPLILNKPHIVGYMSVDVLRHYYSDLSQLKFLTSIPKGKLNFDLNHNINKAVKRTTDASNENITLLLRFLLNQTPNPDFSFLTDFDYTIITYRRTLISVMCNSLGRSEQLRIVASLYNGCIYLCSLETPQDVIKREFRSKQDEKFCAWGYKFEQYMLSDFPSIPPDITKPVIENEEFSIYYCSKLGNHKLFYGAQIDGLIALENSVPEPPKASDVETNLHYLRNNHFVELKTNREIQGRRQEQNFKKYKLLRCWCQCYLANLKGLLVGYRNDEGIVQRVQWWDTEQIVSYCKNEWNPQTCLDYLDYFLSYVKKSFQTIATDTANDKTVTLQFDVNVDGTINVNQKFENEDNILPNWYINANKQ